MRTCVRARARACVCVCVCVWNGWVPGPGVCVCVCVCVCERIQTSMRIVHCKNLSAIPRSKRNKLFIAIHANVICFCIRIRRGFTFFDESFLKHICLLDELWVLPNLKSTKKKEKRRRAFKKKYTATKVLTHWWSLEKSLEIQKESVTENPPRSSTHKLDTIKMSKLRIANHFTLMLAEFTPSHCLPASGHTALN